MEGSTEELRRGEGRRKQLTSRVGLILRQLGDGPGRRKLDRRLLIGRSRIPHRAGCSHRRIMVDVLGRMDGWWKRSSTEMSFNVRFPETCSQPLWRKTPHSDRERTRDFSPLSPQPREY